jgi:membrane protein involved in colicin uptake
MLRRFLLPLLGLAFFATEAASAQTTPAAKPVAGAYSHPVARPKALTARERRAAEAAAKAEAAAAKAAAVAPAQTDATASTSWNGWSNEPLPADTGGPRRPTMNVSVAPGMPLNQVGHGVTTDYHGRPLRHEVASTSLSTAR